MNANLKASLDLMKEAQQQYEAAVQAAAEPFGTAMSELFEKIPTLASIVWTQYTPYFNDGDACEFSKNDFLVYLEGNPEPDTDGYEDLNSWEMNRFETVDQKIAHIEEVQKSWNEEVEGHQKECFERLRLITPEQYTLLRETLLAMEQLGDTFYLDLFGDHKRIVADRSGVMAEGYEHD